jgi:hypothetical protein
MGFFLYLRGYGRSDPDAISRLSKATDRSPADARLLLMAKFPKCLSCHGEFDDAAAALEKLQSHQFEGFLAGQDEVERVPAIAQAGKAEVEEQAVSWWHARRQWAASPELGDIQDRRIHQTRDHVRAIFRANIRTFARIEHQVTRRSDAGYAKISQTRTEGVTTEGDREQALFIKGSGYDAFVFVRENDFDFSCLGPDRVYGPGANIGRLAARLRQIFPAAFYDESLLQYAGEMGFAFRTSTVPGAGPIAESQNTDHHTNLNSVVQMARLLSLQHGLA